MRGAIAYVRVSTERQGEKGISLDGQLIQIRQFASKTGFRINKIFREIGSAMGKDPAKLPLRRQACALSKKKRWPIIVAGLDRFARNVDLLEIYVRDDRLQVISANCGPESNYVILQSQGARAQMEGEEIGRRTKEGLARAKARGARLGNPINLEEAQRKGAEANKAIARQRAQEFERMLAEASGSGARTADQIASSLNDLGYKTPRGAVWTQENVYRVMRQLEAFKREEAESATPPLTRSAPAQHLKVTQERDARLEAKPEGREDTEWGIF